MTNFYSNKFTCNYEGLPPQAMSHYFLYYSVAMKSYVSCRGGMTSLKESIVGCETHIRSICSMKLVETAIEAKCHLAIAQMAKVIEDFPTIKNANKLLQHTMINRSVELVYNSSEDILRFARYGFCENEMRNNNSKCINKAIAKCTSDELRVVQGNRMKMEDLEPLIQRHPDMHVVHYTRDPRGIALSRINTGKLVFDNDNVSAVREAEFICPRMREDLRQRRILEQKYPGVFTHITYESLAQDPLGTARKFYSLVQKSPPDRWNDFVEENMYADGPKNRAWIGTKVTNSTETALKWKTQLSKDELVSISSFCGDVIQDLGYQL